MGSLLPSAVVLATWGGGLLGCLPEHTAVQMWKVVGKKR